VIGLLSAGMLESTRLSAVETCVATSLLSEGGRSGEEEGGAITSKKPKMYQSRQLTTEVE